MLVSEDCFTASSSFLEFDLLVTLHFQVINLPPLLLLFGLFLLISIGVIDFGITKKFRALPFLLVRCNLTIFIVVIDVHNLSIKVEYGLSDLLGCRLCWIKIKFLRHFLDWDLLCVITFLNFKILRRFARSIRIEAVTTIGKVVWPIFVLLNDLVLLLSNELLSQNEAIVVSMMVIVELLVLAIDLDELFPMEVLSLLI